jgi:hypothetical protein
MTALCKIAAPLLVVSMLCLSACSEAPDGKDEILANLYDKRALEFEPCERASTTPAASLVSESRCMIFERPENPDLADGRQIPLQVMVIPSLQSNPSAGSPSHPCRGTRSGSHRTGEPRPHFQQDSTSPRYSSARPTRGPASSARCVAQRNLRS